MMSWTALRLGSSTIRPTFARDQSSEKQSLSTTSVSLLKPAKKGFERAFRVRIRNSVSTVRGICTGPAPLGPSSNTVHRPRMLVSVGGRTREQHFAPTKAACENRSSSLCSIMPLDVVVRVWLATSWSRGGCSSGSSPQARSTTVAGVSSCWTGPGGTRRAASTWKITSTGTPAGTILAAANWGGVPRGARASRSPARKSSSDV
mmetsp:Transcript_17555/g.51274  ORF Transcript_17555/g.51274 Transcript_17555/m.51274 type:complete len:204 (+) Transcript_17555:1167-1778(+)